jgi:hypothetical protein
MNPLPRVTERTREKIAQEFDDLGPDICMAEIVQDLEKTNPEFLDMASKCARDIGNPAKIMLGFGMFYRLLMAQWPGTGEKSLLSPLPRVASETRELLLQQFDRKGAEAFTMEIIADLEKNNPQLLQMAHNFASGQKDYLSVMQGFALLYKSLIVQSAVDRTYLH